MHHAGHRLLPRVDERILAAVGLPSVLGRDYLYAFNILANEGIKAEVRYIDSTRDDTFATPEDAYEKLATMIDDSAAVRASDEEREQARANLREWLAANLVPNVTAALPAARASSNSPGALPSLASSPGPSSPGIPTSAKGPGIAPGPLASCRF